LAGPLAGSVHESGCERVFDPVALLRRGGAEGAHRDGVCSGVFVGVMGSTVVSFGGLWCFWRSGGPGFRAVSGFLGLGAGVGGAFAVGVPGV
jgi:hypothetical protein